MKRKYCIIGGCPFLGYHIGNALLEEGHSVTFFDDGNKLQMEEQMQRFNHVQGNVLHQRAVENAISGVDCVIYTSPLTATENEQKATDRMKPIICIYGTRNIIEACCLKGVSALVYSTVHEPIIGGQQSENFTRIAEQMVLLANKKQHESTTGILKTCSIELAVGLSKLEQPFGNENEVHEAVEAHLKAAKALLNHDEDVAKGGQSYCISGNNLVHNKAIPGPHFGVEDSRKWIGRLDLSRILENYVGSEKGIQHNRVRSYALDIIIGLLFALLMMSCLPITG